jgi:hypothetical protein
VLIKIAVKRARSWAHAFSIGERKSIIALAFSIDVGLISWANRLTESTNESKSRLAKALVRVAIIIVSRRTVIADSSNSNIFRFADTLSSDWAVEFSRTFTGNN